MASLKQQPKGITATMWQGVIMTELEYQISKRETLEDQLIRVNMALDALDGKGTLGVFVKNECLLDVVEAWNADKLSAVHLDDAIKEAERKFLVLKNATLEMREW